MNEINEKLHCEECHQESSNFFYHKNSMVCEYCKRYLDTLKSEIEPEEINDVYEGRP